MRKSGHSVVPRGQSWTNQNATTEKSNGARNFDVEQTNQRATNPVKATSTVGFRNLVVVLVEMSTTLTCFLMLRFIQMQNKYIYSKIQKSENQNFFFRIWDMCWWCKSMDSLCWNVFSLENSHSIHYFRFIWDVRNVISVLWSEVLIGVKASESGKFSVYSVIYNCIFISFVTFKNTNKW